MTTDTDLDWRAAVARPGRTFDAVADIAQAGVEVFAPREMRARRLSRTSKRAVEPYAVPACGPYLFVGLARGQRVPASKHVVDLLRIGDEPARVDHRSIARMRDLDGQWSTLPEYSAPVSPRALRVGDEVTIGGNAWGKVKITALAKGAVTVSFQAFGGIREAVVKRELIAAE